MPDRSPNETRVVRRRSGHPAAFVLAVLSGVVLLPVFDSAAFAQSSPSAAVSLSGTSVEVGTAVTATMTFGGLEPDSDTSTTDYVFRADVVGADGCEGGGMGQDRYFRKVDEDPETREATVSADCPAGDYTVRVSLSSVANEELASASASFVVVAPPSPQEPCSDSPSPVGVEVEVVPIVVESTTADYFVLYVRHELDADTAVGLPVLVTLGQAGTTSLAENVAALPEERYRVEKYLIADPADVDGDCIDDITELEALGRMNPVNPAASIDISDGAVAVPDRETFETLSRARSAGWAGKSQLKFIVLGLDTDRPRVYFQNTKTHSAHKYFMDAFGLMSGQSGGLLRGSVVYDPELVAPDGSLGAYFFWSQVWSEDSFRVVSRLYALIAASMPVLEDNLAWYWRNNDLLFFQSELPLYRQSRIDLVFNEDVYPETGFVALNPGEGYGRLRVMEPDERPNPRDVVVYEALPNELPRVAGIVSTVPQTPLSHVNLRAVQDGVPNAFIRGALDDADVDDLIGSYVRYEVTDSGWDLSAATRAEVDSHHAASRPAAGQTPQRDLTVTEVTALGDIEFEDWTAFGVKAANVAVLGTLGFPAGTVPDGFAVPFYFYDEFMKHNGFYDDVEEMLADTDFQTDFDTQESELKKLRKAIKKAKTPEWMTEALTEMHGEFAEGASLRYRSSTNNEDLPGFNGAGLYDSKTQHADETEEDGIAKSLKQVYASLWNFRAFAERDFHRIDHLAAAMGVLVHPNYSDELANGVAVSFDPTSDRDGRYYVNTQVGEDLVTNPDAHSVPEEILLTKWGTTVLGTSNQVTPGQLLMSEDQLRQLRRHLTVIHERFAGLYGVGPGERFAIEIEFKITSDNILAIKQARPWVFEGASTTPLPVSDSADATLSALTLSDVTLAFDSATTTYTATVGNDVTQTTVTPTTSDDGATYAIKLDGVAVADGVVPLTVGGNVITVVVTAEDGNAAKTYTVTVTRAEPVSGPAVAIALSPSGPVEEGAEVTVTMSFAGLEHDSDRSDVDYIFRADVKDSANGNADGCEDQKGGYGLGVVRYMSQVDEDPEVRTGTVSASCEPGDYTVEVSISSPGNVELASAAADFTVAAPARQQPEPLSADATLSGLTLSGVALAFASTTTEYTAVVAHEVDETTVSPTTHDGGASYAVKLGNAVDEDGTVELSVGANAITVEVTAEDGETTKTYAVTVTRAGPPPPDPQTEPVPEADLIPEPERGAWLESNPENGSFVGEWQHFTLRGSGLDTVDLSVNVIGFGGAPSSTGAVGYATASPPPAAAEVCASAYYSGYQMSVDSTFSLMGCQEGTVIIELLDPTDGWALLQRYTVTVKGLSDRQ